VHKRSSHSALSSPVTMADYILTEQRLFHQRAIHTQRWRTTRGSLPWATRGLGGRFPNRTAVRLSRDVLLKPAQDLQADGRTRLAREPPHTWQVATRTSGAAVHCLRAMARMVAPSSSRVGSAPAARRERTTGSEASPAHAGGGGEWEGEGRRRGGRKPPLVPFVPPTTNRTHLAKRRS